MPVRNWLSTAVGKFIHSQEIVNEQRQNPAKARFFL